MGRHIDNRLLPRLDSYCKLADDEGRQRDARPTAGTKNQKTRRFQRVQTMGDTGLELASGAQVGPDCLVLLGFGALRSAQVRSNCYQNCYQGQGQAATVE